MVLWSAQEMLDRQHQRVDVPAHAMVGRGNAGQTTSKSGRPCPMLWLAEDMLDRQHQRVDVPVHAVVGRGSTGQTTSKNGCPCPCCDCSRWPPAEKTGS